MTNCRKYSKFLNGKLLKSDVSCSWIKIFKINVNLKINLKKDLEFALLNKKLTNFNQ